MCIDFKFIFALFYKNDFFLLSSVVISFFSIIIMSISFPLSTFTTLDRDARQTVIKDCCVVSETTGDTIECFIVHDKQVYLPKYYVEQYLPQFIPSVKPWNTISTVETTFRLRDYQLAVKKEVDEIIQNFQSIILSLHCGWGKSYFAILYALEMGLQTVVTVYRVSHLEQWKDSIRTVNPALRVQILENKTVVEPNMDFYLILGENMANRSYTEFAGVGMFIVDECHMFCTPRMSKAFLRVQPKYCLALSATPFRSDQLDKILQVHFGYSIIRRKLFRPFNVYKYETKLKPETRETEQGQLDWAHVITSQANRPERNAIIVKLCQFFRNRTIMILTKRVEQHGSLLKDMLEQAGESVDMFAGMAQTYNKDARILVATYSKAGVGFDNPKLDMLIVAGDVEEMFEQYLGRVFRRMDTVPIIIDMVDNFHVFEKHFQTRMLTYLQSGGLIKPFQTHFPEFYSTFDVLFRRGIRIVQKEPTPPKEKSVEKSVEKKDETDLNQKMLALRKKKEVSPSRQELLPENLNPLHKPILPQFVQAAKAKKKSPKVKEQKVPKAQKDKKTEPLQKDNNQIPTNKIEPLQKDNNPNPTNKKTDPIPKKTRVRVIKVLPPTVPIEPPATTLVEPPATVPSEQVPLLLPTQPLEVLPI